MLTHNNLAKGALSQGAEQFVVSYHFISGFLLLAHFEIRVTFYHLFVLKILNQTISNIRLPCLFIRAASPLFLLLKILINFWWALRFILFSDNHFFTYFWNLWLPLDDIISSLFLFIRLFSNVRISDCALSTCMNCRTRDIFRARSSSLSRLSRLACSRTPQSHTSLNDCWVLILLNLTSVLIRNRFSLSNFFDTISLLKRILIIRFKATLWSRAASTIPLFVLSQLFFFFPWINLIFL